MEDHVIPPELAETDDALRGAIGRATEPVPVSAEHLVRIRTALAGEAAHRDRVSRRDWWVPAGVLGVMSVGVVGPTMPLVTGVAFTVAIVWTYLLVQTLDQGGFPEGSSA